MTQTELRTLGFEQASDWHKYSGTGSLQSSAMHSEGAYSLELSGMGFLAIRNQTPITKDEHPAPAVVGYDLWIPTNQINPEWAGDTQLSIDAPSAGIYSQYIGYRSLQTLPKGQFVRVEFPLPDNIREALNVSNYNDLRFNLALNVPPGSAAHYVDRFILGPDPGVQPCTPLSDNNPCTADECDPATGQTSYVPLAPDALCSDGNVCNGMELCDGAGSCQAGTALAIDDENPCTVDSCDSVTGVQHVPELAGMSCADDDECNGEELCDGAGACVVGDALEVDDGNPCTADSCDSELGVENVPLDSGVSCDDGNVCNGVSVCDGAGTCTAGSAPNLDDGNPCTADACDPSGGVTHTPVSAGISCDDGDLCNGESLCDGAGTCVAGSSPVIDDGNVCTDDSCDPVAGVIHISAVAGTACDDGNACSSGDSCDGAGTCTPGPSMDINDGNPCTADVCDPNGGVSHIPLEAGLACGDGNACNGAETCDGAGTCQAGVAPVVDDGNPCTIDSCDPTGGVSHTPEPEGISCDDENVCNGEETCDGAGVCQPGVPAQVDDGNPCTIGSCDSQTGVVSQTPVPQGAPCGDGDLCNGYNLCDGYGTCLPGMPLDSDDGNPCTVDSCDPLFGVQHDPASASTSCSDGDACNGTESCDGFGSCSPGVEPDPDDENECTFDYCDSETGVVNEPEPAGTSCGDDDHCDSSGNCGQCTVTSLVNECGTNEACVPGGVCVSTDVVLSPPALPERKSLRTFDMVSFLFQGVEPVQRGVETGAIEPRRVSGLRGRVVDANDDPVQGVLVDLPGHPELGYTFSRDDGWYDLAVNGGGEVRVRYQLAGHGVVERRPSVPWDEFVRIDDVILVPFSADVALIQAGNSTFQVASTSVSGPRGNRKHEIMFPAGTTAVMIDESGNRTNLSTMSVRITEYTVGAKGPKQMPASLPPTTAYTLAFEASIDEAVVGGSHRVEFNEPVIHYVEDFLGMPVGGAVPVGYFDRSDGQWHEQPDGLVVKILAVTGGLAELDIDGSGSQASSSALGLLGIGDDERTLLAQDFSIGTSLMRAPLSHFSTFDYNWPSRYLGSGGSSGHGKTPDGPSASSTGPSRRRTGQKSGKKKKCDLEAEGSTINLNDRTVAEEILLAGVPFPLVHDSATHAGASHKLEVIASGDTIHEGVSSIEVTLAVAGRNLSRIVDALPNQAVTFEWDGLDVYGRPTTGRHRANVTITYVYPTYYVEPPSAGFGTYSPRPFIEPLVRANDISISSNYAAYLTPPTTQSLLADITGLGAWTLPIHHTLELSTGTVLRGDGTVQGGPNQNGHFLAEAQSLVASESSVRRMAQGTDGTYYRKGTPPPGSQLNSSAQIIEKYDPSQGIFVPWAGGAACSGDDRGDGLPVEFMGRTCFSFQIQVLEPGPDGSLYIATGDRIRRIRPDGIIESIAGQDHARCPQTTCDVDVEARFAAISTVKDMKVASNGTVHIIQSPLWQLFSVTPGGRLINPKPGNLSGYYNQFVWEQPFTIAVDSASNLYLSREQYISRLTPNGEVDVITGEASNCNYQSVYCGEGKGADVMEFGQIRGMVTDDTGRLFVHDDYRLASFVPPAGPVRIETAQMASAMDGAELSTSFGIRQLAKGPQGLLFSQISPDRKHELYRVGASAAGVGVEASEYSVASANDSSEVFIFALDGRHIRTENATTGATLWSFGFDSNSRLKTITDAHGNVVQIDRTASGVPAAIVGAHGQRTVLTIDSTGGLSRVTAPDASQFAMTYVLGTNLLETFRDRAGRQTKFTYDEFGFLISEQAFDGGLQSLELLTFDQETDRQTLFTRPSGTEFLVTEPSGSASQTEDKIYGPTTALYADGSESIRTAAPSGDIMSISRDGVSRATTYKADPFISGKTEYPSKLTTILPESAIMRVDTESRTIDYRGMRRKTECVASTAGNLCTTMDYDATTGIRTTETPEGRVTTEFLDELERVNELLPPGSPRIRMVYEGDKVTAIVIDPDGVANNGDERQTLMEYDASTGLLSKVIDPLTHETLFGNYDLADRPGSITLPDESQVLMSYDAEGNVASVTPPGKSAHGMTYGPKGRIESYTPPVGNAIQFFYDLDRRMDLIDFGLNGQGQPAQVDFSYNPTTGQLSTITSPTGSIVVGYQNAHMTTLTAPSVNGSIVTSIDYDGFLPTALSWAGPVAGEVQWTYNDRFLIASETIGALPSTTVQYSYDKDGLVTQAGDLVIQRDPTSGRVISKTIGNIRESFSYNEFAELSRQRVVLLNAMGAEKETLYDVIYDDNGTYGARDALGRITKKTEWIVSEDEPGTEPRPLDARTYDYGYNAEGRPWLESVAVNDNVVSSYGYDENGNRTSAELNWSQLGYSTEFDVSLDETDTGYNQADQLLTYGTKSYTWNNFGQLEAMHDSATNETTEYEYDLYGNLLSVALPDGRTIEYEVDGAGRRVGRRELDPQGNEISFKGWIYRDLLRPIAEVNDLGEVTARYIYSDGDGARQNGVEQLAVNF